MNPLSYSLAEVRKFVVAAVIAALAAVAFFVAYDPGFEEAVVSLVGAVFAAIGVFADRNATEDDVSKAVTALQGAALSVVGFFATVPAETETQIGVLVGALLSVYLIWRTRNDYVTP